MKCIVTQLRHWSRLTRFFHLLGIDLFPAKWALVDPLSGDAAPCRLVARGVGRYVACKGSAAEFVSPISMRHRLPFAHYAAPYAAVLASKASDECSEFCEEAGLCAA